MKLIYRFLREYARPYLRQYLLGLVCLVVTNWIVATVPELVGRALDHLATGEPADLLDARDLALQICLLAVGIVGFRTFSRTLFFNPGREIEYRLGVDLFAHLLRLPRVFFDRRKVGELLSIVISDVQSVRLLVGFAGLQVCNVVIGVPVYLYKMWQADPVMTMWAAGPVAVGALYMRFTVARFYGMIKHGQAKIAAVSDRVLECYSGIGSIRAHVADEAAVARFRERNEDLLALQLRVSALRSFALPVLANSGYVAMGLVLWIGGQRVISGDMRLGQLSTFSGLLVLLVAILTSLVWVLVAISRGSVSLQRVNALFAEPVMDDRPAQAGDSGAAPRLELRNLQFKYSTPPHRDERHASPADGESFELTDISFEVEPGETLGIFGATGSGKSTLLDLIARTYEAPEASVFIDGEDIRSTPVAQLRSTMSVVSQDPFLFSARMRDNISMEVLRADAAGDRGPASDDDDPRLEEVIDAAALRVDVERLPDGLDTLVGERGVILSGGQRQRTSLARALYRRPRLLLLDDVLSAVDQNTEAQLVAAIRHLDGNERDRGLRPTTLIVSHRTSVLEHAQQIIVMDAGRIVERGTHDQLLARGGLYAAAHAHQAEGERGHDD